MNTNIATTQDQSQRLLRCGVSADTADMCWHGAIVPRVGSLTSMPEPSEEWDLWADPYSSMPEEMQAAKLMEDYYEIQPAWSLSTLLGLLPFKIHGGKYEYWLDIAPMDYGRQWSIGYYCMERPRVIKGLTHTDSLIECAVQEIEWLTANDYKLNDCSCQEKGGKEQ